MTFRGLAARIRRGLFWVFGWAGLLLVLVLVALETSAGRSFVLRAALGAISRRTGLVARAEAMEVKVLRREVRVRGLSLSGPDSEPLVRVADLRLGWSLLPVGRGLTPEFVDVQGVRIDLRLDGDGRFSLPAGGTSSAPAGAGPPVLPLRISLRDVAVEVSDRTHGLDAHVGGISLQATGSRRETAGTLDIKEPLRWHAGSQTGEIEFTPAYFRLGQALIFEKWSARSSEATVRLQGTWADLFGANGLALTFDADLDLRRLAARAGMPPLIDGSLRLEGRIGGPLGKPQADLTWRSDDTRAGGHRMKLAGRAALTGQSLDLGSASVMIAGGSVEGSGRVGFAPATASRFEAHGNGLDLASLLAPNGDRPGHPSVRSLVAGQVRASWPGLEWRRAHAQAVVEASAAGTSGGAGLPVEGEARLDLRGGKWKVEAHAHSGDDARLTGQLGGELGSQDLGGTSVSGRFDFEAPDLAPLASALEDLKVAGQGRGRVLVAGTFDSPRAAIDLQGLGVRRGQAPTANLSAQATVDRAGLTLEAFDLHSGSAHGEASGRLHFANGGLEGRYEIDLPDLAVLEPALPAGLDPGGALHGKGSFGGTWREPTATLTAEGTELRLAGQAAQTGRFVLGLEGHALRADSIELVQAEGRLSAKGAYDSRKGQFSLSVRGRAVEVGALPAGLLGPESLRLGGQVDLGFEGAGTRSAREGRGRIVFSDGRWNGRSLGPLAADLDLTREGLRADITAHDLSAHVEVRVSLDPPHAFSVAARLDGSDLTTAAKVAGLDASLTSGTVSLRAKANGALDDPKATAVSLSIDKLAGTVRGRSLRLDHETQVDVAPGLVRVDALELALGASRLHLEGALDAQGKGLLRGKVEGRLADFAGIVAPGTGPEGSESEARFDGLTGVSFVVSGPPARPRVSAEGHLEEGVFRFGPPPSGEPPLPPIEHVKAKASLDSGALRLDHLEAAFAGSSLAASGDANASFLSAWWPASLSAPEPGPTPRASLRARLEGDAGRLLAPFLGDRVRGSGHSAVMTAVLEADDARPEAVRGEIRLEGADLQTSEIALRQQGAATLRVQEGRLALGGAVWSGPLTELHLSAQARIGPQDDPVRGADLGAELSGDADLRLMQTLGRGFESGGTARFRLKVAGKPSALVSEGEVHLHGGALRHRPTHMALDGLTGTLRFGPSGFEMEGLRGSLNGGPVEGSGALRPRASGPGFEGALRLQARNVFLEWPLGLRAGLRANLILEPLDDGLRLAGSLRVRDGTYRTREYFSLQVLELVSRFSAGTSASRFDPLRLDLSVKSNEDLLLDAVDGRLAVGIDLHLGGSVGKPEIGGRLTAAAGGQLFMSGRTYDVDSAFLDFTRGAGFEPWVQARASTRVSDYTVVADVAGPATRTMTRFASTPPLGEQDIVALLTSGRTVGAGGTGTQSDALSMASGGMLGKTGQRLGLDSLKIASTPDPQSLDFDPTAISSEADPASRLTFSKRLASNLSATFSQSLTKAGSYTWFVAWKPKPPLELRVVQRDDRTGALEFRHDLTIGGGKPAATPSPRRRRRRRSGETVSAVSLTGDPVAARPSDLRMKVGQAFDYERWLEDRDGLEDALARAGYSEGRVLASRETPLAVETDPAPRTSASSTVALVYDVRRGPRTSLTIEGVPSPGDLRTRIERAWHLGDFGSTIEEEARILARAHLYARGFLRAQVTSRVWTSPDGDQKTLSVRAEAGAPVHSRRIVFRGNVQISRERLTALVKDKRRAEAAWLAPDDLREAVLSLYKSEGFLAATVEAPRVTFAGDQAQLAVTIDEGPVVKVGQVRVTGAQRLTAETVLAEARLPEGQPFKPAEVESAKARVESAYRRLGYNQATVRSHGDLDAAAGTMKVELEVKEGPREVLAEVAVEGGSPKVQARIRRQLRFTPGAPVDLDQWTEARRRVYETGLFRTVDITPGASPATVDGEGDLPVKATVRVEAWPDLRLRYGLQLVTGGNLASEEGRQDLQVGAVAEVSRQTLFGRAASTGVSVQLRQQEQEARAYLSLPRTFGTRVRSSLFLTATPERTSNDVLGAQADVHKTELTWEERMRIWRRLSFAAAYKLQWSRFDFGQSVPDAGESGPSDIKLARLVGTALFDARNDLIDTSRGAFTSASLEWGGDAVGSDYPLDKALLQQFVYLPGPRGMVMGAAARVERASGQGSAFLDTDRLQAGGANTVRGYSEDVLTSRSLINFLGGSTTLLVLNAELRFPIHGSVRGVIFGDGAISRARFSEESTKESIWSTGLGLRYVTPVGILRLDFGIPLDEGFKPGRGRVYFSLGQVF